MLLNRYDIARFRPIWPRFDPDLTYNLGRDASALFPSIVKLVASSKPELKKLVYVYLERYAQEQQELALLSISTFQRGLKDHNQVCLLSKYHITWYQITVLADTRMRPPCFIFNSSSNNSSNFAPRDKRSRSWYVTICSENSRPRNSKTCRNWWIMPWWANRNNFSFARW